eukprot:m.68167 g.68167  ORF g.68167 m.68167 type:complete len:112 (+) comp11608_c0_seq8:848-1183(+)
MERKKLIDWCVTRVSNYILVFWFFSNVCLQAWNLKNASMLTKLIGDVFGDNCQTAVIAHLNSVSKTALPKYLQLCSKMQKVHRIPNAIVWMCACVFMFSKSSLCCLFIFLV